MARSPDIRILEVDHGLFPAASSLNRKMGPDRPLLLVTLDIHWDEPEPVAALTGLEEALAVFSPSFAHHECRGPRAYHVFTPANHPESTNRDLAPAATRRPAPVPDPRLALAHLIEHAIIDFQCSITDEVRCSGFTGAHRDPPGRYDVMVECADFAVGRCCLALAVVWLTAGAAGRAPGLPERRILAAARRIHFGNGALWTPPRMARALRIGEGEAREALEALRQVGYLEASEWTLNFSGVPWYRLPSGSIPPEGNQTKNL